MNEGGSSGARFGGAYILVLEDEALIAANLAMVFEDEGAEVATARNVEGALARIEERQPDAAILDVRLGRGVTCEQVALELQRRGVPFVLHSGDLDRQGEVIRRLGAPVIAKPAIDADIMEALASAMRDRKEGVSK